MVICRICTDLAKHWMGLYSWSDRFASLWIAPFCWRFSSVQICIYHRSHAGHVSTFAALFQFCLAGCLCLIWKWYRWLGVTLIGFLGMLHPAEFISFFRSDLLLPGDTLNKTAAFYVHIGNPKTARFARKQHCTSLHM